MNASRWQETLDELREQGLRVRVQHLRQFRIRSALSSSGLVTVGAFKALPEETIAPHDLYVVDPCGGTTICQLLTLDDDPQVVIETSVRCSKRDHYNRRIGRTKALGLALHALTEARTDGRLSIPA